MWIVFLGPQDATEGLSRGGPLPSRAGQAARAARMQEPRVGSSGNGGRAGKMWADGLYALEQPDLAGGLRERKLSIQEGF